VAAGLLAAFQVASDFGIINSAGPACGTSRLLLNSDAPAKPKSLDQVGLARYISSRNLVAANGLATELAVYLQFRNLFQC